MKFARASLVLATLPLALALSACGKKDDASSAAPTTSSTPIAKIAPPAGKQWSDVVSVTPEGGYLMGNPKAPIKLVEFGALSCSHCAEFADEGAAKLRDDYVDSGRVSYELRFFMLNALDVPAVLLATCGPTGTTIPLADQFWAWQPNMFKNLQAADKNALKAAGDLPPEKRFAAIAQIAGMTDFFAARGISRGQAASCLADTAKATVLANHTQEATDKYGVNGTPTFYLNGKDIGSLMWAGLEPILQDAGAR